MAQKWGAGRGGGLGPRAPHASQPLPVEKQPQAPGRGDEARVQEAELLVVGGEQLQARLAPAGRPHGLRAGPAGPAVGPAPRRTPPGAPSDTAAPREHRVTLGCCGPCVPPQEAEEGMGGSAGAREPGGVPGGGGAARSGRSRRAGCGLRAWPCPSPDGPRSAVCGRTQLHTSVRRRRSLICELHAAGLGRATHLPQVRQLPDFRLVGGAVLSEVPGDQLLIGGGGRRWPLRRADVGPHLWPSGTPTSAMWAQRWGAVSTRIPSPTPVGPVLCAT